ncbi:MAG: glycosyltransferase family 2 protein [Lachnospiraceae bacterium]|nr:glycosyltransferase family 2 protein [Lachnospiraceae bacterium]
MSIKATIIVPVYNGRDRVLKCIESIFSQSYHNIELLIFDDGSKDDSYDVLQAYIKDNRPDWCEVSLVKQENMGVAKTRNKGIKCAAGEYVFFVDQDDFLDINYCADYITEAEKTHSDIVVGGYERISDNGDVLRVVDLKDYAWSKFLVVAPWAHLYRRDFLKDNSIAFLPSKIGEDVYFNLVAYSYTDKIAVLVGNTNYKWVNNMESVSNSRQVEATKDGSPIYLLKEIHKSLLNNTTTDNRLREYFFIRYIVWYMLFTLRGTKKDIYFNVIKELFDWLKSEYPEYKNNRYIFRKPKGEINSVSMSVKIVMILHRLHMDRICLGFLTKRK